MQRSRYYPFERNKYFYGKLLTVRDFESEQKYFNDKRRLLNRLLHGTGIVSGLQVIKVDDKSVSVEMGVALDHLGREIVVPSPVTLKLSMVQGFSNNEYAKNVYLCIAYDEKGKEPVHSVTGASGRDEEVGEYNRTFETYKLFVKEEAPDPASFEYANLGFSTVVLHEDAQVRVLQQVPRFVQAGNVFPVTVRIEKTLQTPPVSLSLDVNGTNCSPAGISSTVAFAEPADRKQTHHEFTYPFKAADTPDSDARLELADGSTLTCGDKTIPLQPPSANAFQVVSGSVEDHLLDAYFSRSLDQALDSPAEPCIYLAKINLMQMGPTYLIDQVEPVPFDEYIYNSSLLWRLGGTGGKGGTGTAAGPTLSIKSTTDTLAPGSQPNLDVEFDHVKQELSFTLGIPQAEKHNRSEAVAMGYADIPIISSKAGFNPFSRGDRNFVSDEIEHGLGSGDVYVMAGLEDSNDDVVADILRQGDRVFYGDADVFKETAFEPDLPHVSIGTLVYPKKGTFRIGLKLLSPTERPKVRLRWWAFRNEADAQPAVVEHTKREAAAGDTTGAASEDQQE